MHKSAYNYIKRNVKDITPQHILDVGALDVNSTEQGLNLRSLFPDSDYIGIDEHAGAGVDLVKSAAKYDGETAFDLVLSTEAMEHAKRPQDIVECAWRALKSGGVFLITCAGPGRAAHNCSGSGWDGVEPYQNVEPEDLKTWLADWEDVQVEHHPSIGDVYARAVKP